MHIGHEDGINQLLYPRCDVCDQQLFAVCGLIQDVAASIKNLSVDAVDDEKDLPRLNYSAS